MSIGLGATTTEVEFVQSLNAPPWVINHPCPADLAPVQERLNQLAGFTVDGHPKVRAEWGQEEMIWEYGEPVAKYLFCRVPIPREYSYYDFDLGQQIVQPWQEAPFSPLTAPEFFTWENYDVGIPRIWFSKVVERSEYAFDWDRYRWYSAETEQFVTGPSELDESIVDLLGPLPDKLYFPLFMIASHAKCGCNGTGAIEKVHGGVTPCYGEFRLPVDFDYKRLRKSLAAQQQAKRVDADKGKYPQWFQEQLTLDSLNQNLAHYEQQRVRMRERNADHIKTHIAQFVDTTLTEKQWGRYAFMGGHSKSGLPQQPAPPAKVAPVTE